jgi:uncharacterized protein YgbK (DUF1537 family)
MAAAMRAGIVADDLTGACDTGAVFAVRGLATTVLLPAAPVPASLPDVLVIDTESRGLSTGEARCGAREAVLRLAGTRPALLYKKVDSTLRGALAAELAGALDGMGARWAVLAPSLPAQRRTLVDGLLRIDGRPAEETAVARDPAFPVTGASVLALLAAGGLRPAGLVPLLSVRRGAAAIAARLARVPGCLVCDAETDADLAALAAAAETTPGLLAGSAGFAAALASRMPARPGRPPSLRRPFLVVAGSAHPLARQQAARAGARGIAVLTPPPDSGGDRAATARALADAARQAIERTAPRSVLLTGGETAYSVCRALGAHALALGGEAEPGVAIGTLLDGPFDGLTVLTKAGGFGDPDTLVRLHEAAT